MHQTVSDELHFAGDVEILDSGVGRDGTVYADDRRNEHGAAERERSFLRAVLRGTTAVLLFALLVLAAAVAVVPRMMDRAALTVLTGSMEPICSPGDMVVAVPQDAYGDRGTSSPSSRSR